MPWPSFYPFIVKRPWLVKLVTPLAKWHMNAAGYRQLGLLHDDLVSEESEEVIQALKRLPPQLAYDRVYRIRRAIQCSIQHKQLPKEQWTKPEEDYDYLGPIILQIRAEKKEKKLLDSLVVAKKPKA